MKRRLAVREIEIIAREYERGTPVELIARRLGRSVNSIVGAAYKRGMRHANNGLGRTRQKGGRR